MRMSSQEIYCPVCGGLLEVTHYDRYEDLSDHVSNPNGVPSLKPGYQCNGDNCYASAINCTWIESGGMFLDNPVGITYSEAYKKVKELSSSGMEYAIGSFSDNYERGKNKIKKLSFRINLYWIKISFEPMEKDGNNHDQYHPNPFKWKLSYWKRVTRGNNKGHYTNLIPITRMISFQIKNFKRNYDLALSRKVKGNYIEKCLKAMEGVVFTEKDERLFMRASSWIIKNFYSGRCEIIRAMAEVENINLK